MTNSVTQSKDAAEILQEEIDAAQRELQPTSRRALALKLQTATGVAFKDAMDIVDAYCDEKAPAVPTYLASEFGIYWLKVVAVAFVALGIGAAWYGKQVWDAHGAPWPAFVATTILVGLGALSWVKSIERGG